MGHHANRDVDIEYLSPAGGREDPLRNFVEEFKAGLAVVVLWGERSLQAVRLLRPQPGVVLLLYNEPRLRLHLSSLERPGGNLTGVTATTPTSITEQVQLLKHAAPHISRPALVWDPSDPGNIRAFNEAFAAVAASGLAGHSVEVRDAAQFSPAIAAAVSADAELLDAEALPLELREEPASRWVNEIWDGGRRPRRGDPRGDFGEEGRRQASQWITLTLVRPGGQ